MSTARRRWLGAAAALGATWAAAGARAQSAPAPTGARNAPGEAPASWSGDFEITVRGQGERVVSAARGLTIWRIDRHIRGRWALTRRAFAPSLPNMPDRDNTARWVTWHFETGSQGQPAVARFDDELYREGNFGADENAASRSRDLEAARTPGGDAPASSRGGMLQVDRVAGRYWFRLPSVSVRAATQWVADRRGRSLSLAYQHDEQVKELEAVGFWLQMPPELSMITGAWPADAQSLVLSRRASLLLPLVSQMNAGVDFELRCELRPG